MNSAKTKTFGSLLLIGLTLLLAIIYSRSEYTVFYVRNDTGLGSLNVEVELDNELIFSGEVKDFYIPDTAFSAKTDFGSHSLRVRSSGLVQEEHFIAGLSKYIVVELSKPADSGLAKLQVTKSLNPIMFN